MKAKSPRPDVIKMTIEKIGGFDGDKLDDGWEFSGMIGGVMHPKSVGTYISEDWVLYGGYTVGELRSIKNIIKGPSTNLTKVSN